MSCVVVYVIVLLCFVVIVKFIVVTADVVIDFDNYGDDNFGISFLTPLEIQNS